MNRFEHLLNAYRDQKQRERKDKILMKSRREVAVNGNGTSGYTVTGFETHAFATLWTRLTPYLSATDGGAVHALPWSAVLRGDNRAYLWTSPVGPGDLQGLMGELASTH